MYDCVGFAGVAQLVEQRIRNAQVMGSSPFTGSRHFSPSYFAPLVRGFFYGSKDTLSCLPSSAIAILTKLVLYGVAPPRRTNAYCLRRRALSETFGGWLYCLQRRALYRTL